MPAPQIKPYPNEALTDICKQLLFEWNLTPKQIGNLAMDIAGEVQAILDAHDEAAFEALNRTRLPSGG
jgi:hypothetical protein